MVYYVSRPSSLSSDVTPEDGNKAFLDKAGAILMLSLQTLIVDVMPKFEVLIAMEDEVSVSLDGKALGNLRVVDLKQELDKRGLSKSGSKKDLVKRLKQLDAATEQNEFVQQYLAQQQKIYAEQKEVKRLVELEDTLKNAWHNFWPTAIFHGEDDDDDSHEFESFRISQTKGEIFQLMNFVKKCGEVVVNEDDIAEVFHCNDDALIISQLIEGEICCMVLDPENTTTNSEESDKEVIENEKISIDKFLLPGIQSSFIVNCGYGEIHKSSDEQESCEYTEVDDNQETFENLTENSELVKITENANKEDDNQETSDDSTGNSELVKITENANKENDNQETSDNSTGNSELVKITENCNKEDDNQETSEDPTENSELVKITENCNKEDDNQETSEDPTENSELVKITENVNREDDNQEISKEPTENPKLVKESRTVTKENDNSLNDKDVKGYTLEFEDSKNAIVTHSSKFSRCVVLTDKEDRCLVLHSLSLSAPIGETSSLGAKESDIQISCNQELSSDMDSATPIQSVPYSLSDIQLPESPGSISKSVSQISSDVSSASHVTSEKNDIESTEKNTENQLHSNGVISPGIVVSSSNRNTSKRRNSDSDSEDATGESCDTPNSVNSVNCSDEKQNIENSQKNSLSNTSQTLDHKTKKDNPVHEEEKIIPKADVESTKEQSRESSKGKERARRSRSSSEDSDNGRSPDSGEANAQKLKPVSDGSDEEIKERKRSKSSSSDSSQNSESSPDRNFNKSKSTRRNSSGNSKKSSSVPNTEKTKTNSPSDTEHMSKYVNAASSKQKLKIKRDNVLISKTKSLPKETSKESGALKDNQSSNIPASPSSNSSVKDDVPKVADVLKATYSSRKVCLSGRKINRKSTEEIPSDAPKVKKSKWSSFATTQKKSQSINISMDSLKNWFPDFKLINEPVPVNELVSGENSPSIKEEKVSNLFHTDSASIDEPSVKPNTSSKKQAEPDVKPESMDDSREVENASKIIFVQNLVRPFTLLQLKELLKQSGNLIEEHFWIDKIKSKCFVMYETEEEAIKARNALNGTRWPVSNPKILSVEFATEDDIEYHKRGSEPPKTVPEPTNQSVETYEARNVHPVEEHRKKERDRKKERERSKTRMPVREWDKDKISQDSPEKDSAINRESDSKAKSSEKRERKDSKRRPNEDTPAKLLDDLFQKTKASPCIYWLPLTDEQVNEREEAKRLRRIEREKRNQQAREQEESERKSKRARSGRRSRELIILMVRSLNVLVTKRDVLLRGSVWKKASWKPGLFSISYNHGGGHLRKLAVIDDQFTTLQAKRVQNQTVGNIAQQLRMAIISWFTVARLHKGGLFAYILNAAYH
ncbi:Apoptotic chromatin condensation inducer in the nucleus, partial [Stegodyphus mimosarum]